MGGNPKQGRMETRNQIYLKIQDQYMYESLLQFTSKSAKIFFLLIFVGVSCLNKQMAFNVSKFISV